MGTSVTSVAEASLVDELLSPRRVQLAVHDATHLGWSVALPAPQTKYLEYALEFEVEIPTSLVGEADLWSAFQADARLDAAAEDNNGTKESFPTGFRRSVVGVSVRLARARDGFIRHTTLMRSEPTADENHVRALTLWVTAARETLSRARETLLASEEVNTTERALADEFLSARLWTVLTDCTRSLRDLEQAFESRSVASGPLTFDAVEQAISAAVTGEIAYRKQHGVTNAEPVNGLQLDRLATRLRWLKRRFEHVLMLERESYEVVSRASGWLSALAAVVAYLWFFVVQTAFEHRTATVGWGLVLFAIASGVAYASRDRLKELTRDWLAGRVQRIFAQRVIRFRPPSIPGKRYAPIIVARESFSRSSRSARRLDDDEPLRDVTVVRFAHRGRVLRPERPTPWQSPHVRLHFRLDVSSLLPRMKEAVRGFVAPDRTSGELTIVDVPRNYDLPIRIRFRHERQAAEGEHVLTANKNGLVRVCDGHLAS